MNEVASTELEAALGKDSNALLIRGICSLLLYTPRHSSRHELSLDALTDGVPKVPKCALGGLVAPCHLRVSSRRCTGYMRSITFCFVPPELSGSLHLPETQREFDLILQKRQAVCFSREHFLPDL